MSADVAFRPRRGRANQLGAALGNFFGVLVRDRYALAGTLIYLAFASVALFAPLLATHDPTEILFTPEGLLANNQRPSSEHPSAPPAWAATSTRSSSMAPARH
jgi:hypothetical protein